MVVVPGSYERVEAQPQGIGDFFMAPIKGFVSAAQIIAFVFLVGGAFSMLNRTGAVDAGLQQIIRRSQSNPGMKKWVIPIVMTLFSVCGATFGMSEEVLVFVLITIPLAIALGYDLITGVAISFIGAGAGFAGAFLNPFTIGIAQGIAELTPFSGMGYRLIVWFIMTAIVIIYVYRYAAKLEKDPTLSPVYHIQKGGGAFFNQKQASIPFTGRRKMTLMILLLVLLVLIFGVSKWGWYIDEITGLFVAMGICVAIVGQLSMDEALDSFKEGAKEMLVPAIVIALAKGLIVVASDGRIIDTILYAISNGAQSLPKGVSVEIMFILQSFLNFFVPSGSGQAALTMPIMAPLSDLLGISRQVAVLAFQFGDGISNLIIPTSGVTMGVLAIAKIPYNIWLKWMMPLFVILTIAAMILLVLPVMFFEYA
jgi:uncharacterized ion transporter superfamily protein YfcC